MMQKKKKLQTFDGISKNEDIEVFNHHQIA